MISALTPEQVSTFLTYIGVPTHLQAQGYTGDVERDVYLLNQLHIYMISAVPYENLTIHYSRSRTIVIDPHSAYQKIVVNHRGRGGYCMEVSILFHHVLRALDFDVYMSAVRIRERKDGVPFGPYTGWRHLVNIVTLSDGSRWSLDVGFGGDGPTRPMPLVENRPQKNLGMQEVRLLREHLPTQVNRRPGTELWIYQYRNGPGRDWNSFYAFGEVEAMEADFVVVNWYTGGFPASLQRSQVLTIKFLRQAKGDGRELDEQEIYGKRMLVDRIVKQNLGGRTQVVQECLTESERIGALREHFGIELTPEERDSITGWVSELPR